MTKLPPNAVCYKTTKLFTPENLPDVFKNNHHTKAGVWGRITLKSGSLRLQRFDVNDISNCIAEEILNVGETAVFAPQEPHAVQFIKSGGFTIGFHHIEEK